MQEPTGSRDAGWWWQAALTVLVAPFYVGLFVITAVGAAFGSRRPRG